MSKRAGTLLMLIAALHQCVGVIFYWPALTEIVQAGVINSVNPPHWQRDAACWFLMFGGVLFMLGWLVQWLIKHVHLVPAHLAWFILNMCLVGIILMPLSGFWLAVPVALALIRQPRMYAGTPNTA